MDPIGLCFAESLRGIKHNQVFKKAPYVRGFWNIKHPCLNTIKWKEYQMDPIGLCFAESLRGIKHNQVFKKAPYVRGFWNIKHPCLNTIKWKEYQMDPIGLCFAESLRGIKHLYYGISIHKTQSTFPWVQKFDYLNWQFRLVSMKPA